MFVGHFAVGFGAKRLAPRASLGTLFLAAQFVDLVWPLFLLVGLETVRIAPGITTVNSLDFVHYPITHSLVAAIVWGVLAGLVYWSLRRYRAGAWVLGGAVISHWFLDLLVHRPDLPLAPGVETTVGLGLWNSLAATLMVESAVLAFGLRVYLGVTRPIDRIGSLGLAALVVALVGFWLADILGPPPPSEGTLAVLANAMWLFVLWGYWIDRHRAPASEMRF